MTQIRNSFHNTIYYTPFSKKEVLERFSNALAATSRFPSDLSNEERIALRWAKKVKSRLCGVEGCCCRCIDNIIDD